MRLNYEHDRKAEIVYHVKRGAIIVHVKDLKRFEDIHKAVGARVVVEPIGGDFMRIYSIMQDMRELARK